MSKMQLEGAQLDVLVARLLWYFGRMNEALDRPLWVQPKAARAVVASPETAVLIACVDTTILGRLLFSQHQKLLDDCLFAIPHPS